MRGELSQTSDSLNLLLLNLPLELTRNQLHFNWLDISLFFIIEPLEQLPIAIRVLIANDLPRGCYLIAKSL